ncbi:MAG: hypothetical protein CBC13_03875 [Planctomycetia bacterium TMED53]|nr:MAG: hypothetical protein CBC13_03875 [Planctomycetia bacterium TMED53]
MKMESGGDTLCISIAGNPNVGKSTLFNALLSGRARVSNYPGITAEALNGQGSWGEVKVEVTDLPGCYGLQLDLPESRLCNEHFAAQNKSHLIVSVIDAVGLRRNMNMLAECLQQDCSHIIVITRTDEARLRGIEIDFDRFREQVGVPVIELANKNSHRQEPIKDQFLEAAKNAPESIEVDDVAEWGDDLVAAVSRPVRPEEARKRKEKEDRLDGMLLHPIWGLASFLIVMGLLFGSVFWLAQFPMEWLDNFFASVSSWVGSAMPEGEIRDLVTEGIIGGVSGTLIFLPQVLLLFFLISLLEETGYLARAALVADRWLRPFGLPGHSFVPLLSSHACAIPGILCTRLIPDRRDRLAAILVAPFLSCAARLPVYQLLVGLLFPNNPFIAGLAFIGCYLLGALAAILTAFLVRQFLLPGRSPYLLLELPPFQRPAILDSLKTAGYRGWLFVKNAGTVILLMCIVLWWLGSYPKTDESAQVLDLRARAEATASAEESSLIEAEADALAAREGTSASYLGQIGRTVEPVFAPIGADWQLSISVMASFAAREVFVSATSVLLGTGEEDDPQTLMQKIKGSKRDDGSPLLTPSSAAGLLVFFVLAMQCLPTLAVTRKEAGGWKWALLQLVWMSLLAWSLAAAFRVFLLSLGVA